MVHKIHPVSHLPLVTAIRYPSSNKFRRGKEDPCRVKRSEKKWAIRWVRVGDDAGTAGTRWYILPETNIAPENRPLEKEIPIRNHHF